MKRILFLLVCSVLLFTSRSVRAQQDPHFSHYMFNYLYINPAYASVEGLSRATLIHRSQWLGYDATFDKGGAPTTQVLTGNYPLRMFSAPNINSGVGLIVVNDRLGALRNFTTKLAYSYQQKLGVGTLHGGIRVGIYNQRLDASLLRAADEDDAVVNGLGGNAVRQSKPDIGLGVWYQTKKYFGGISFSHVAKFQFNYGVQGVNSRFKRHMYINGGYIWQVSPSVLVTPTALIATDFSETSYNLGATGSLNNYKYWGGLQFRQSIGKKDIQKGGSRLINDDIYLLIGIGLLENNSLRIGYGLDVVTSGPKAKNPTSHEIMLSYVLPIGANNNPPPLRTPRYRHDN